MNADILVHDIFEHRPRDKGHPKEEIRAAGAKLRFLDVVLYGDIYVTIEAWEVFQKRDFVENKKNLTVIKKGKRSLKRLATAFSKFQAVDISINEAYKLVKEGYKHALQYNIKPYRKL